MKSILHVSQLSRFQPGISAHVQFMTAGKFTTFVDYNETFSNDHLSFKNTFGSSTTDT